MKTSTVYVSFVTIALCLACGGPMASAAPKGPAGAPADARQAGEPAFRLVAPAEQDGPPAELPMAYSYLDQTHVDRGIEASVRHDGKRLKLAFRIPLREDYRPDTLTGRDEPYYKRNCIELHFRVGEDGEHRQIVLNLNGEILDRNESDGKAWDSKTDATGRREGGLWILEAAIPFEDLRIDPGALPAEILFNAVVRVIDPKPGESFMISAARCTERQFSHRANLGVLRVARGEPYVNTFDLDFVRKARQTWLKETLTIQNPTGRPVKYTFDGEDETIPADMLEWNVQSSSLLVDGDMPYRIELDGFFCLRLPVRDPYQLDAEIFRRGDDDIAFALANPPRAAEIADAVRIELDGETHGPIALDELDAFAASADAIKPGEYTAKMTFYDGDKAVAKTQIPFLKVDETPIDFDLRDLDVSEYYPAMEVEESDKAVTVHAARSAFAYAHGPLPAEIETDGRSLLRGPVELLVDGEPARWPAASLAESHRNFARFRTARADCNGPEVSLDAQLDYDGLTWAQGLARTNADSPARLTLRIPLRFDGEAIFYSDSFRAFDEQFQIGEMLLASNRRKRIGWSYPLKEGSTFVPLTPTVQVVDDFGGITLYLPSAPAKLELARYDRIVEIRRDGQNVDLLLHLAEGEFPWPDGRLRFSFGLQPMPIRTLVDDYMLTEARKINRMYFYDNRLLTPEGTHGAYSYLVHRWSDLHSYTDTIERNGLIEEFVSRAWDLGIRPLLYIGFEMSDAIPEAPLYRRTCIREPHGKPWIRQDIPDQRSLSVCYGSLWGDLFLRNVEAMIERWNLGGLYMDSTLLPGFCANGLHGHRLVDSRGRVVPYITTREMRRFSQILYRIARAHDPNFILDLHGMPTSPATTGLVNNLWHGEQVEPKLGEHGVPLPMALLRAQYNSRAIGIPIELLSYNFKNWQMQFAMVLPFDTLPRTQARRGPVAKNIFKLWEVFREYDLRRHSFTGFWQPDAEVREAKGTFLVSYYDTDEHLVVVASNYPGETAATRTIDLGRFAGEIEPSGTELFGRTGEYRTDDGRLELTIPGHDFRMIAFEKSAAR